MAEENFRKIRPFKVVAIFMVTVAIVMTIVSLAGPDWVSVTFYTGTVKSWGLWSDCYKVHTSLELCVSNDWLGACAAMVIISMLTDILIIVLGIVGLCTKKRLPYFLAGVLCIVSIISFIICLIIYPVKFTDDVEDNEDYKAETSEFVFDWTYGLAWGSVCFLICAAIFFFIRVPEEHEEVLSMKSVQPHYYESDNAASNSFYA